MAFYVRQRIVATSNAGITTAAVTTLNGSCLVAFWYTWNGNFFTSVTDSKSNSWQTAIAAFGAGGGTTFGGALYVPNCVGGSSHTFTLNTSTGTDTGFCIYEIADADASAPLGNTHTANGVTSPRSPGGLSAGATVDEIFLAFSSIVWGAEGTPAITSGNHWASLGATKGVDGYATGFAHVAAGGSDTMTFTTGASAPGAEVDMILAIRASSGGGGGGNGVSRARVVNP